MSTLCRIDKTKPGFNVGIKEALGLKANMGAEKKDLDATSHMGALRQVHPSSYFMYTIRTPYAFFLSCTKRGS
jgi:hypothetical protein